MKLKANQNFTKKTKKKKTKVKISINKRIILKCCICNTNFEGKEKKKDIVDVLLSGQCYHTLS